MTYNIKVPERHNNPESLKTISKILSLDLEPIKFKMQKSEDSEQLSLERLDTIEHLYKLFLICCAVQPNEIFAPTPSVDKMWHHHILDTRKYFEDCESIFGKYLHHNPYFGFEETEGKKVLNEAGNNLIDFAKEFTPEDTWQSLDNLAIAECQPTLCSVFDRPTVNRPALVREDMIEFNLLTE